MTIKAILFDRDQTLLTVDPVWIARLEQQIQALAPKLRVQDIARCLECWSGFLPQVPADEPQLWADVLGQLAKPHQIPNDARQPLQALLSSYDEHFVAYPESATVIQMLRQRGYLLAVFTNAPLPSVDRSLRCGGLDPSWFDVIASSVHLGVAKPDPTVFHLIARQLGVQPAACLVVDDQAGHVAAAQAAGFPAVCIQRAANTDRSTAIDSLVALETLLS